MNTQHINVFRDTARKPVLAVVLVLLVLFSALASASPCVHHWLHEDDQSPSHYCAVTVVEHGQAEASSVWVSVAPAIFGVPNSALLCESFFISHDLTLHPERGPPVLS